MTNHPALNELRDLLGPKVFEHWRRRWAMAVGVEVVTNTAALRMRPVLREWVRRRSLRRAVRAVEREESLHPGEIVNVETVVQENSATEATTCWLTVLRWRPR